MRKHVSIFKTIVQSECRTSGRFEDAATYTNVSIKKTTKTRDSALIVLSGPSSRDVRRLFLHKLADKLNERYRNIKFFVYDPGGSLKFSGTMSGSDQESPNLKIETKSGFLFGVNLAEQRRIYISENVGRLMTSYKQRHGVNDLPRDVRLEIQQYVKMDSQDREKVFEFIKDRINKTDTIYKKITHGIKYTVYCRPKSTSGSEAKFKIYPNKIPGMTGSPITASSLKEKTINYIKSHDEILVPLFEQLFDELETKDETRLDSMLQYGSEAIELFSAYYVLNKLNRSSSLRQRLGLTGNYSLVGRNAYKIEFPTAANLPLVDYFVVVPNSDEKIKVSVKNAALGSTPNTIKPKNLFSNSREIVQWKKGYGGEEQKNQYLTIAPAISMKSTGPGKTNVLYPLLSVKWFASGNRSQIVKYTTDYLKSTGIKPFPNMTLDDIANYIIDYIKKNLKLNTLSKTQPITDPTMRLILQNTVLAKSSQNNLDMSALNHMCEKIFMKSSSPGNGNMNFKTMFEDRAIYHHQVIYCTAKDNKTNNGTVIYFELAGKYNWSKYEGKWMSLRTKNTTTRQDDALGIDPRLF